MAEEHQLSKRTIRTLRPPPSLTLAIIRQGIWAITLLLGVIIGTFFLFYLVPGDPARVILGPNASEEAVSRLARQLGTDQSLGQQLIDYTERLARLDLGRSVANGRSVRVEVVEKFAVTARIGAIAAILALLGSYLVNLLDIPGNAQRLQTEPRL